MFVTMLMVSSVLLVVLAMFVVKIVVDWTCYLLSPLVIDWFLPWGLSVVVVTVNGVGVI